MLTCTADFISLICLFYVNPQLVREEEHTFSEWEKGLVLSVNVTQKQVRRLFGQYSQKET